MKASEWFWLYFHAFTCWFWLGWFIFALLSSNESLSWHKACIITAFWSAFATLGWFNAKANKRGDRA